MQRKIDKLLWPDAKRRLKSISLLARAGTNFGHVNGEYQITIARCCGTIDQVGTSAAGTTWQLGLTLSGSASNVYTIYGDGTSSMVIPAASQVGAPFGANVGGVSPALIAVNAAAGYDSWLTVGITEGDSAGALGSVGIDWGSWTGDTGLTVDNGAVFW